MTETKEKGSYTYFTDEGLEFTLEIPIFWETIYKGKPRERLYEEYIQMLNIVKKLPKDKIIVDVGCNFGLFSVPCSLLGYQVVAFEPVKSNAETSFNNLTANGCKNFEVHNAAIFTKNGYMDIFIPECPDNASLNKDAAVANMIRKNSTVESVRTIYFDAFIEGNPQLSNVGLIKIDTQGAEWDVISSMAIFLKQAKDIYIIAEYEEHLLKYGHTYKELDDLILSFGFKQVGRISNDKVFYKQ